ncbi:MAG TPA: 6-bladed beta-propeller [Candidatus Dormibacteraeota bacterium]|jgi:DNA-binding beta-propeller fold protein YncE|nr:6-bladed beta-propeller [Candidatus Dormibacteraeota bacterium]
MRHRLAPAAIAILSVGLVSCGGGSSTQAPASASTQNSWQVVLTLTGSSANSDPLAGGGFGIAGIVLDGRGNLYLTEMDDAFIYEYTTAGALVRKWGGYGSDPGQLTYPEKLALDAQGNVYVTEFGSPSFGGSQGENDRIQKFSPTGSPLAHWGMLGSGPGQFNGPVGIAVDPQGNIFVADVGNHRIQKLSPTGQPLAQWHTVGSGVGETTETGFDLALDAAGDLYVSEPHPSGPGNERIEKFSPAGQPLAHWGESGSGPGQFNKPFCLTLDSKGDVFVVDSGNNRIEKFSPTGKYLGQWKGPQKGFIATSKPAVDDQGNLYVTRANEVVKLVVK